MSETREQFRYRLGEAAYVAQGFNRLDWRDEYENSTFADDVVDAAEAGYAQALRDVLDLIGDRHFQVVWRREIESFAAERGIDLGADTDSGPPAPPPPRKTIDQHAQDDMLERLERRIKDGRKLIEDRRAAGIDVTQLETFLVDLQHQFDQLSEVKP